MRGEHPNRSDLRKHVGMLSAKVRAIREIVESPNVETGKLVGALEDLHFAETEFQTLLGPAISEMLAAART